MKTKTEEFQRRLYAETIAMIRERGVKGWSMEGLGKRSGIAKDTLYRVVPTKQALIERAVLAELEGHSLAMEAHLGRTEDFFDVLRGSASLLAAFLETLPFVALGEIFLEYPSVESVIEGAMADYYAKLECFLARGKRAGRIRKSADPKFIVNVLRVCVLEFLAKPDAYDAPKDAARLVDCLISGISAD
jgi:AcrR family transcriptional regulator